MSKTSSFPDTQKSLSQLKETVLDGASELKSTVSSHASKAKSQWGDLVENVQEEGGSQLERVTEGLSNLAAGARNLVAERPLVCLASVLAIGILIGLSRRGNSR